VDKILTIQIPYELARYAVGQRSIVNRYSTNQVIKALDTWLVLKAEAPGSYIQNWNKQKEHLLSLCKCSETIFRHRLQLLKKIFLLQFDRHHIRLCSWDAMAKLMDIDITQKFSIQYEISSKQRVQEWIIATEIKDNQSRQAYMVLKNVNKNPETKEVFTAAMIKAGADATRLKEPEYFLGQLKSLYLQDFVQASEIHQELISIRPYTDRGVRSMAATWKAKHGMTISYWKNVLQKAGIIDVSKLEVVSTTRTRNEFCRVKWLDTKKIRASVPERRMQQTILFLCDQIFVMEPWLIKNFLLAA